MNKNVTVYSLKNNNKMNTNELTARLIDREYCQYL